MAYMTINEMRKQLIAAYPGGSAWKYKVNNMPPNQVFATYKRIIIEGKNK